MTVFYSLIRRRVGCCLLPRCVKTPSASNAYSYTSSSSSLQHIIICNNFQCQRRYLAGHNKWSKIKRKKGANDVARAKAHTRVSRAIEVASRSCQGDMADIHLQSAISAARGVQLPKERIEKAIERGANPHMKSEGEEYVERRYDGMIPTPSSGKIGVIIETLTENKNRTAANIRNIVTTKAGGELLPTGSNDWLFEHVGLIWVSKYMHSGDRDADSSIKGAEIEEDALLECALEGGATDVEFGLADSDNDEDEDAKTSDSNYAMIKCQPNDMLLLVQTLQSSGYDTTQFEKQWLVKDEGNIISLDKESEEKFERFLEHMDDDLDVTNVFHSAKFGDET